MRDDSHRWTPPRAPDAQIAGGDVTLRTVPGLRQTLISGPRVLRDVTVPLVEWPTVADGAHYALSLRRDRVLAVGGPERADGWDSARGWAVSDVSDGYAVLDLQGEGAFEVICRGTEISLEQPSRSVSRLFFGIGAIVYRYGSETEFRIHVASGQSEAMWHSLRMAMGHAG